MTVHINGYEIDVFTDENHSFDSMVTSDPVETGSNLTDHIKPLSDTVTLTGIVSDTPFGVLEDDRNTPFDATDTSYHMGEISQTALDFLKAVRDLREPVTIETSLGKYLNMAMEKLSVPRNVGTGDSLQFTATFKQIRIVSTERETVKVKKPRLGRKSKRGNSSNQSTTEVQATPPVEDKPASNQSWFSQGVEAAARAVS